MPTYDYKCDHCENVFEAFQAMSDDPLTDCPDCGGSIRRLISGGSGIIFKGNGFYITDYKNKESKNKQSTTSENPKSSESQTGSKTDTKTESSKETKSDTKPVQKAGEVN